MPALLCFGGVAFISAIFRGRNDSRVAAYGPVHPTPTIAHAIPMTDVQHHSPESGGQQFAYGQGQMPMQQSQYGKVQQQIQYAQMVPITQAHQVHMTSMQ